MQTVTDSAHHQHLMLKILIGSAWVDRHLVPAEVTYLNKVLARYHQAHDPELQALLSHPVSLGQTEGWLVDYLKDSPDSERLKLLAAIGNLLISDDKVSDIEHDLLDEFHTLMAKIPSPPEPLFDIKEHSPTILQQLGKFFRHVFSAIHA
ncbi:TerB family tellurite resistance protein [Altericista sp. CCNU0014]|uniref:tellurite resistance TerB family protein n=1 Tax=Altericista sp. CCNU0014 TaxID=3082949 RepID=UPI00384A9FB1